MLYAIKDIKPNPFRNIDHYPIDKGRVLELRESLRATGFWDNMVARVVNGKPEIAYGHHRLAALKEEYKPGYQVDLIIKDLDDRAMIKIMANENMEEWKHSAETIMETVRAVVQAYAAGLIKLPLVGRDTNYKHVRYAPSLMAGNALDAIESVGTTKPYTVESLAKFLDWQEPNGRAKQKLRDAVLALELIEQGILTEKDFKGLTVYQARAVVEQSRKTLDRRESTARIHEQQAALVEVPRQKAVILQKAAAVREEGRQRAIAVGQAVSRELKEGKIGYKKADEVRYAVDKPDKKPIWIDDFVEQTQKYVSEFLDPYADPKRCKALDELVAHRDHISDRPRNNFIKTLRLVAARLTDLASKIES